MKLHASQPLKRSYWQESAEQFAPCPSLKGEQRADVVIVGGGFVGLWTALSIKQHEPDCQVVVLEQDVCGGGASGRNGGFVMSWWPKIGTLTSFCSKEQALFLGRSSEAAIFELGEFCEAHGIDAHFVQEGWLWTATTPAHVNSWNSTLQACERLGVKPFELIDPKELRRRTGSFLHLAGVLESSNATVQPAELVKGMRRVAIESGVKIYEHSPVVRIEPGHPVGVHTSGGVLRADRLVLATNAWSSAIPELARLITPVNSSIVATQPLPTLMAQIGWTGGESITDSQLMVNYYRTTRDERIVFGKGTGAISYGSKINGVFSDDPASIGLVNEDLFRTYPALKPEMVTHGWSGPIDRTYDSLPVFGCLGGSTNIFYGIGWSGNGVGPSRLGGRILASLALGRQDQWSQCALVNRQCKTFPPEPFRYIGGNLVRNAVIRKEKAEMNGQVPKKLDRLFAGLAPAGLEDKS